jgi:hypothetical protein
MRNAGTITIFYVRIPLHLRGCIVYSSSTNDLSAEDKG